MCMYDLCRVLNNWAMTWQNQQSGCASSEDSDQPGHPPSLIRVFAVRMKKAWFLSYPLSAHSFCWFSHAVAQFSSMFLTDDIFMYFMDWVNKMLLCSVWYPVFYDLYPSCTSWSSRLGKGSSLHLRIKIWFFDIHLVMNPVGGAKIPWSTKRFL